MESFRKKAMRIFIEIKALAVSPETILTALSN